MKYNFIVQTFVRKVTEKCIINDYNHKHKRRFFL